MQGFDPVLDAALAQLETATKFIVDNKANLDGLAAIAVPYLRLFGYAAGGVMLARSVKACTKEVDEKFAARKKATAEFYMIHILTQADGLAKVVSTGMSAAHLATDLV